MPASVGLLLALIVIATVTSWILRNLEWAALSPTAVLDGQVWRLVTWAFVQDHPLTLIFGGMMLYSFGNQLAYDWGEGRFLWTFFLLTGGSAILTVALAAVWPGRPGELNWPRTVLLGWLNDIRRDLQFCARARRLQEWPHALRIRWQQRQGKLAGFREGWKVYRSNDQ